jgi:hypothetical protein
MIRVVMILLAASSAFAAEIRVDALSGQKAISPYLYGRNNSLSDNPKKPLAAKDWQFLRDAGVQMLRECGGNNATKYNWVLKLSSHPDWYNNVYAHNWDFAAASLQANLPGAAGMWAFQLIGKAAANTSHNFNDWGYNRSQWWSGVGNNWAGGGGPLPGGGQKEGDPDFYLMDWSADDTTAILDHWFDPNGLGLDPNQFLYWSMDNEPEIWSGTHDDVCPQQPPVEEFLQAYFAVARLARVRLPGIKLVGPVAANEWQWYNWNNDRIGAGGRYYSWLEYFIMRVAQEQQASGVRLLDVLDLHFYPGETKPSDIVQLHRVWFDENYQYPGANGVRRLGKSGWDTSITGEYIFTRCRRWLEQYMGPEHGVTFGVSEMGIKGDNPNVTAVWYASTLGVFADEGVELFTPWSWKVGMWEVLHLLGRYQQAIRVQATPSRGDPIGAYASISAAGDALTILLVNPSLSASTSVRVVVSNFPAPNGKYKLLRLSNLPAAETFRSHTDNALQEDAVTLQDGVIDLALPPLSVNAILLWIPGTDVTVGSPVH